MRCKYCGFNNKEDAVKCTNCETLLDQDKKPDEPIIEKQRSTKNLETQKHSFNEIYNDLLEYFSDFTRNLRAFWFVGLIITAVIAFLLQKLKLPGNAIITINIIGIILCILSVLLVLFNLHKPEDLGSWWGETKRKYNIKLFKFTIIIFILVITISLLMPVYSLFIPIMLTGWFFYFGIFVWGSSLNYLTEEKEFSGERLHSFVDLIENRYPLTSDNSRLNEDKELIFKRIKEVLPSIVEIQKRLVQIELEDAYKTIEEREYITIDYNIPYGKCRMYIYINSFGQHLYISFVGYYIGNYIFDIKNRLFCPFIAMSKKSIELSRRYILGESQAALSSMGGDITQLSQKIKPIVSLDPTSTFRIPRTEFIGEDILSFECTIKQVLKNILIDLRN
jgi:FtsH-binding integral membrane protein